MQITVRVSGLSALSALVLALIPSVASGQPVGEAEGNDTMATANRPTMIGDSWIGALQTSNDSDTFALFVGPGSTQLHAAVSNTTTNPQYSDSTTDGTCDAAIAFHLLDGTGEDLVRLDGFSDSLSAGYSGSIDYTLEGPGTYYLDASGSAGCDVYVGSTYSIAVSASQPLLTAPYVAPLPPAPPASPAAPAPAAACKVPKLKARTLAAARNGLSAAHCRLGRATYRKHVPRRRARVIRQSVAAGAVRPTGTVVNVTLGRR